MRILLFLLFTCLGAPSCFGQEQITKNLLSLNLGLSNLARQDLIFSPMIHKDLTFLNVGFSYTRQAKLFQKVSLRYGNFNPMVTSPYDFTVHGEKHTATPHSFHFIDLDYLLGKSLKTSLKSAFIVGGLFMMDIEAMNYVYGRTSSFGYYATLGLGVFGRYRHVITDRSDLTATLQLPFMTWLARSPYLVNDDEFIENTESHTGFQTFTSFIEDGELVTWNRLQTFDFEVNYTYNLNEKWNVGAAYLVEYIHSSLPRNLLSYRQSINLSINMRF